MKIRNILPYLILLISALFPQHLQAQELSEQQLLQDVETSPAAVSPREKLAEFYLKEGYIDKSLEQWKRILELVPEHARAKQVTERLTSGSVALDRYLDTIAELLEQGVLEQMDSMLGMAAERAATDAQKARILFLQGVHADMQNDDTEAVIKWKAVWKLYPETEWAGYALLETAELYDNDESPNLVRAAFETAATDRVKERALYWLTRLETSSQDPSEQLTTLRALLEQLRGRELKITVSLAIAELLQELNEGWIPESVDLVLSAAQLAEQRSDFETAAEQLGKILDESAHERVIAYLTAQLHSLTVDSQFQRDLEFLRVEALLKQAVLTQDFQQVSQFIAEARDELASLQAGTPGFERSRLTGLTSRAFLIETQKAVMLLQPVEAIPYLKQTEEYFLSSPGIPQTEALKQLERVAQMFEHLQAWEMAISLYTTLANTYPSEAVGRDMLYKVGFIYKDRLDAPLQALDIFAEYAGRYPPEYLYRDRHVSRLLTQFGYQDVLDFQKANGLQPDGIYGPNTKKALTDVMKRFDAIALPDGDAEHFLLGKFVHPVIFEIAREYEEKGRHREAIHAYHLFLNLYPTKREADDALLAIARLFYDNLLFHEAIGAYKELIYEFPEGNNTSEAYIEIAQCYENLGQWEDAAEYYSLYLSKFPNYAHVKTCETRLEQLSKIRQYGEFIAATPDSPKLAEAQYQIGVILYNDLKRFVKSALEFRKVADLYPEHLRAAEGLFMAGTALLHHQNFPKAREHFDRLVERYPASRLADDGQYWIGHTYEYHARAIGKLDQKRIVLNSRTLQSRAEIVADLELRRRYYPDAAEGFLVQEELWDDHLLGVLTSGSMRDRVNTELLKAIEAYRKVVENFEMGDIAGKALLRIATIYTDYLDDTERGIAAYQELLENYPGSREAENALYEVGVYQMQKQQYEHAITLFQQFGHRFPSSPKTEEAMLAVARCYVEMNMWAEAVDAYQRYVNQYPKGTQVSFAQAQIEWIRMYYF